MTFTLIAFYCAQAATPANGRQLSHQGVRLLPRELAAQFGPAPVVVFTGDVFGAFHIEEIMALISLAPEFSRRSPVPGAYPPPSSLGWNLEQGA